MADDTNNEVFVYTEGAVVPDDVVRVRVHPSVTAIPGEAFKRRYKLKEVELCDGLLEIGNSVFEECNALKRVSVPSTVTRIGISAFSDCGKLEELKLFDGLEEIGDEAFFCCFTLKKIEIPSTVIRIGEWAFAYVPLVNIRLPDCLESLDEYAVASCKFSILRIPPLVTTIRSGLVGSCKGLMSIELSESVTRIEDHSLSCKSLRNVAIPHTADLSIEEHISAFEICDDLKQVFDTHENIASIKESIQ